MDFLDTTVEGESEVASLDGSSASGDGVVEDAPSLAGLADSWGAGLSEEDPVEEELRWKDGAKEEDAEVGALGGETRPMDGPVEEELRRKDGPAEVDAEIVEHENDAFADLSAEDAMLAKVCADKLKFFEEQVKQSGSRRELESKIREGKAALKRKDVESVIPIVCEIGMALQGTVTRDIAQEVVKQRRRSWADVSEEEEKEEEEEKQQQEAKAMLVLSSKARKAKEKTGKKNQNRKGRSQSVGGGGAW